MATVHQFVTPHGKEITTYNPATDEALHTYTKHTTLEAQQVIDQAHEAFKSWKDVSLEERAEILKTMGKLITRDIDEIAEMMTKQMGKPIAQGKEEAKLCAKICEYEATECVQYLQDETREIQDGKTGIITYQPIGVILAAQPWNFPLYQVIRYSSSVLLAGNTTVLMHAPINWAMAEKIRDLWLEAGVPEHAFEIVFVDTDTFDELIAYDKVRGVTMTGSAEGGKAVAQQAGKYLKKSVLELGGSDPYLILEDADLDSMMECLVEGRVNNAGQTCIAAKRFIVVDAIYDTFRDKFVEAMEQVSYGDPMKEDTQMGPMARKDLRDKLQDQVDRAKKAGAEVLCGGEIPDGKGCFYPATVLDNVEPGNPAFDEELFGPVASLIRAKDEEDAIRLANHHSYGLGGGVFSADKERAIKIARERIDTGMVNVNGYAIAQPNMPFGGVKESGWGREHGGFGVREFVNIKSVFVS